MTDSINPTIRTAHHPAPVPAAVAPVLASLTSRDRVTLRDILDLIESQPGGLYAGVTGPLTDGYMDEPMRLVRDCDAPTWEIDWYDAEYGGWITVLYIKQA